MERLLSGESEGHGRGFEVEVEVELKKIFVSQERDPNQVGLYANLGQIFASPFFPRFNRLTFILISFVSWHLLPTNANLTTQHDSNAQVAVDGSKTRRGSRITREHHTGRTRPTFVHLHHLHKTPLHLQTLKMTAL